MKRRLVLSSILLGLILAGTAACTGKPANPPQLVKVTKGDLAVTVSGSGNLSVANQAKLSFAIPGRIVQLNLKEGDKVSKGAVVGKLDDAQFQLALVQAKVALAQAKVGLAQSQANVKVADLALSKTRETYKWPDIQVTQTAIDDAKNLLQYDTSNLQIATTPTQVQQWSFAIAKDQVALATAEARLKAQTIGYDPEEVNIKKSQLDLANQSVDLAIQSLDLATLSLAQAEKNLKDTVLTAPFDGVVLRVGPSVGDTVSTLTLITEMVDLKSLELKAAVDEVDIPSVSVGQAVIVTLDALPDKNLPAKVTAISNASAVQAGVVSYNVTVNFVNDISALLKAGMSATADIVIKEQKGVMLIPNRAIQQDSQGKQTVKVQAGTLIETREITTGISDGVQTEVTGGLQEGDTVVITTKATTSSGGLFGG